MVPDSVGCPVALISTAGVARNDDRPFDQEGERRNPWWGDPIVRLIPLGTTERDVKRYHMHIDHASAKPTSMWCCPRGG